MCKGETLIKSAATDLVGKDGLKIVTFVSSNGIECCLRKSEY